MNWNVSGRRFYNLVLWFSGLALLTACSGLGGEPRIVATIPPSTPLPTEVGFPAAPPDMQVGAAVFADHCTACHGVTGAGDGPLIGAAEGQIPQGPKSFLDVATIAEQTPFAWYSTISNGRIEKMMPPWRDSLTDAERWAVAFYTYTLHNGSEAAARGEALLASAAIELIAVPLSEAVNLTDSELLKHALGDSAAGLQPSEQRDVQAYLRARELMNAVVQPEPPLPAVTPEPDVEVLSEPVVTAEAELLRDTVQGVVTGAVVNGTAGGTVPADLTVTLNVLDAEFRNETRETAVSADGRYIFEDVPIRADRTYIITAQYQGRTFGSDLLAGDPASGLLELPVTIYELTADSAAIEIIGLVWQVSVFEDVVQVAQVVSFRNSSDRAYSTDEVFAGDRYASVRLPVPAGAVLMSVGAGDQRYVTSADGGTVIDTAPVLPGSEHLMQVVYRLPYADGLLLSALLDYAVSGPVRMLLAPPTLQAESSQLVEVGQETLRGVTYRAYGTDTPLPAGSTIAFTVGGAGAASTSDTVPVSTLVSGALLLLGVAVFAVATYRYWRRRPAGRSEGVGDETLPDTEQPLMDALIREIAELDAVFNAGEIDEATYQERRSQLKSRLAEVMARR